ncbi:MAG: hypothetical protein FJ278_05430 [Planctomycetes bacterium]|nr:hypothetical protein [Planctomycetota bacterium]
MHAKPPFRVLFSNDTTNIETCVSPFHRKGEPFRPEMLEATVDETAGTGIEAHLLQPGVGWVPWWKSRAYPFSEHVRFMKERFGKEPSESGYASYMASGGDMVDVFVKRCRQKSLSPFISLRLNDSHGHEFVGKLPDQIPDWAWHVLTPTHVEHPEWRISQNINDWGGRVLNWLLTEARQSKFRFIEEICEQYDLDGFELDFMRHCNFFPAAAPMGQREEIMTGFVRQVRDLLDRTAAPGRRRWLCVRIPCHLAGHEPLGIHVQEFARAGVDMFNLSAYYFTEQQTDAAAIKRLVPDAAVYLETAHTTYVGPTLSTNSRYDNFSFRRTTDLQFYTAAHLAYARGLDGISAFNFVYHREHGVGERGPFAEPPFHVFRRLGDPAWLARQPQHYVLAAVWNEPPITRQLPKTLSPGQPAAFKLDMAPPSGGWRQDGRLRIQAERELGDSLWSATFNGTPLREAPDRSEPYPNPHPPLLGAAEQHRAWFVPVGLVKDGVNSIVVRMDAGKEPAKLVFLDLAVACS